MRVLTPLYCHVWVANVIAYACGGPTRLASPLELELLVVMSHLARVPGTELR